jgi:hypothetical protein
MLWAEVFQAHSDINPLKLTDERKYAAEKVY